MSELFFNKIAFCVLGTGLLMGGLDAGSDALFPAEEVLSTGFPVHPEPVAEMRPDYGALFASADVEAGKAVATKCMLCHNLEAGAKAQTGPPLFGVLGRDVASSNGFKYSAGAGSLSAVTGSWDYAKLDRFIESPKKFASHTGMNFIGLKRQAERINLIAYLRTLTSGEQIPLPPP